MYTFQLNSANLTQFFYAGACDQLKITSGKKFQNKSINYHFMINLGRVLTLSLRPFNLLH